MVARREQQIPHPRTRVDSRWLLCGWVMGIKLRSAGKQQMFSAIESSSSSYSTLHITLPYILSSVSYTVLAFLVDLNTLSRLLSLGLSIG